MTSSDNANKNKNNWAPFGLRAGMLLNEIEGRLMMKSGSSTYLFSDVPMPHSEFDFYILEIPPEIGLIKVSAQGRSINVDRFGNNIKQVFNEMRERFNKKYKKSNLTDKLSEGSFLDNPQNWLLSLQRGERTFGCTWSKESGATLPCSVSRIILAVIVDDEGDGRIVVSYLLNNYSETEFAKFADTNNIF